MNKKNRFLNLNSKQLSTYLMRISMTISIISSLFLIAILYFNVDNYMKNKAFETAENNTSQAVSQIEHEFNIVENYCG